MECLAYLSLLKILYKALFSPCFVLQRLFLAQLLVFNLDKVSLVITGLAVPGVVDLSLLSFYFLKQNLKIIPEMKSLNLSSVSLTLPPRLTFLSWSLSVSVTVWWLLALWTTRGVPATSLPSLPSLLIKFLRLFLSFIAMGISCAEKVRCQTVGYLQRTTHSGGY